MPNIDRKAAAALGLTSGQLLRVTCKDARISITTRFLDVPPGQILKDEKSTPMAAIMARMAAMQQEKQRYPEPRGVGEHAYGEIVPMNDWGGKEFLFCRRSKTKVGIKPKHKQVWLLAVAEVLGE